MKKLNLMMLPALMLIFTLSLEAAQVSIDIHLSPAGDFQAKTKKIKGYISKKGEKYLSKKIYLNLNSLTTHNKLRDKHMKSKYFESDKKQNKNAVLSKFVGQNGKFKAFLEIRKTKVKVLGTYKKKGKQLVAKFKTKLSAYKIKKAKYLGVGVEDEVEVMASVPLK